jgi:hypothetical protein
MMEGKFRRLETILAKATSQMKKLRGKRRKGLAQGYTLNDNGKG